MQLQPVSFLRLALAGPRCWLAPAAETLGARDLFTQQPGEAACIDPLRKPEVGLEPPGRSLSQVTFMVVAGKRHCGVRGPEGR